MSRINTNVSSLIAVNTLNKNNAALQTSLQRLSTGYRINSGKDDPSGLIASQSLTAEQTSTDTAIGNAQQPITSSAPLKARWAKSATCSSACRVSSATPPTAPVFLPTKRTPTSLQVDSILSTINRISNSASFQGVKLLNGNFDYTTSGLTTTSAFTSVSINSASLGGKTLSVTVAVTASAQTGQLNFLGSSTGLNGAATLSIAGNTGTVQFSFASSTKSSAIVASVNQFNDSTGVRRPLSSDNKSVMFTSTDFGASQFVSVTSSNSTALYHQEHHAASPAAPITAGMPR